jgi:probable HAF family extracellular repeat protein
LVHFLMTGDSSQLTPIHAAAYYGGWYDLGTLGGTNSLVESINNEGQIVGHSQISGDTAHHAFLYDSGYMYDIHPQSWGWDWSDAIDINNNELIVGVMGTADYNMQSAFLYDGAMLDLNTVPDIAAAGWTIIGAYGINDSGQIVGDGWFGGVSRAYRLHPQTTSRYMQTVDVNTLYNLGCSQTNQRGIVILDFGKPRVNNGTPVVYGASLFRTDGIFATISEIESAVQSFLSGYYTCHGSSNASLTVAVGTSNNGKFVTPEHGSAWGQMIARLNDYVSNSGWTNRLSVVGASDMELGWNSPATTRGWVDGFALTPNVKYINYGDAQGCPNKGTGPCAKHYNWTQGDVQYISWDNSASFGPVPEIYYNVPPARPHNALQWANLATLNSSMPRFIPGAITTWQACQDRPGDCTDPTNTPLQAWQQLMDALYDANPSMAPIVQKMLYSTDITWQ